MISVAESFVKDILYDYSLESGSWEFTEFYDENGNTTSQAIQYPNDDHWYSYPDFEFYNPNKSTLLVELKCYNSWFNGVEYVLAMRKRQFESYLLISTKKKIDVRVCFGIWLEDDFNIFWQKVSKLNCAKNKKIESISKVVFCDRIGKSKRITEDYIFWDITNFREDYWNLPVV